MSALTSLAHTSLRLRVGATPAWKAVQSVADRGANKIETAYLSATRVGKFALNVGDLTEIIPNRDPRQIETLVLKAVTKMTRLIELRMPEIVRDILGAGGEAAARNARRSGGFRAAESASLIDDLQFNLVNPEALRWAQEESATMVRYITAAQRQAIRIAIARSFAEGIPTAQIANIIKQSIGLDPRRTQALLNLRKRMLANPGGLVYAGRVPIRVPKAGASEALLRDRMKAYSDRLLNQRARSIARTEALAASNEGQRQLWMQAVERDLLFSDELRVWIITGDKRICPVCEGSAGDLAPLDKPFPNGYMNPPAHAMCRCAQGISGKRGKQALQKGQLPATVSLPKPDAGTFTREETDAIRAYRSSSTGLNTALRRGLDVGSENDQYPERLRQLDRALERSVLQSDMTVLRGASKQFGSFEVGTEFQDLAFVSTSTNEWSARGFGDVLLELRVKAGQRALDVNKALQLSQGAVTESEWIIQRGYRFRIVGEDPAYEQQFGVRKLIVEVLG